MAIREEAHCRRQFHPSVGERQTKLAVRASFVHAPRETHISLHAGEILREPRDSVFLHLRAMQEPGLLKTLDGSMDLGRAHAEICRDDRHGWPLAFVGAELENNHYVLRL